MKKLLIIFLALYSSIAFSSFGEDVSPSVKVFHSKGGMRIFTGGAIDYLKSEYPGRKIYISSINIVEINENQKPGRRWVVINEGNPNCRIEPPRIIFYGQKLNKCLRVERNDKYDKNANYLIAIDVYVENIGSIELSVAGE